MQGKLQEQLYQQPWALRLVYRAVQRQPIAGSYEDVSTASSQRLEGRDRGRGRDP